MKAAANSPTIQSIATTRAGRSSSARATRSAVSTGKRLHVVRLGNTAWARRFRDILAALISDSGGEANMTEARTLLIIVFSDHLMLTSPSLTKWQRN